MKIRLSHSQILDGSDLGFIINDVPKGGNGLEMLADSIEERYLGALMLANRIGVKGGMSLRDDGTGVGRFHDVGTVR